MFSRKREQRSEKAPLECVGTEGTLFPADLQSLFCPGALQWEDTKRDNMRMQGIRKTHTLVNASDSKIASLNGGEECTDGSPAR